MANFVFLVSFTDQGVRSVKDTTKRADAFVQMAEKAGVTISSLFWTLGRHDVVAIGEASDDETGILVELLPRRGGSKVPLPAKARHYQISGSTAAKMLICAALAAAALIVAASREPSSVSDNAGQSGYGAPAQTPVPSSR